MEKVEAKPYQQDTGISTYAQWTLGLHPTPEFRRSRALRNRGWLGTRNLRCRDGLHGSDRDVLPNRCWNDKTHPSSMGMNPRRHSWKSRAFEKGEGHRERSQRGKPKTSTDRHSSACFRNCRSSQPSADGSWASSRQQTAEAS